MMDLSYLFGRDPSINPYHQALSDALTNYQNMVKAAYYPQLTEADINYKNSLSNIASGKVLGNPLVAANMTPDQLQQYIQSIIQRSGSGSGTSGQNVDNTQPNNQPDNNQPDNNQPSWFDHIKKIFHQDSTPQATSNVATVTPGERQLSDGTVVDNQGRDISTGQTVTEPVGGFGGNNTATPAQVSAIANRPLNTSYNPDTDGSIDLSDPKMNAFNRDTGNKNMNAALALQYPSAYQKAAQAGLTKKSETTNQISAEQTGKIQDEANKQAEAAVNMMHDEESFKTIYDNSLLKGPGLGKFAWLGSESSKMITLSNDMQTQAAAMLFGNKATNFKESLAAGLKLNPEMKDTAVQATFDRLHATQERAALYPDFVSEAKRMGINGADIQRYWINYNLDMPPYDFKSLKLLPNNNDKYKDYLSNATNGKRIKNTDYSVDDMFKNIVIPQGATTIHMRNDKGMEYDVPATQDKIKEALRRNYYQVK